MADTIPSRLLGQANTRPSAPAYYVRDAGVWRATSWGTYSDQVKQAGRALVALGLDVGSTTTILGFNRPEWVIMNVATMGIGGAAAGIYTTCSPVEVAYIVNHSEAPLILVENEDQWLKVKAERGLLESDFGDWTGAKLSDLRKKPEWAAVQRHPSGFRFPGGESFTEMQVRMTSTLDRLAALHAGKAVVCVSHADPIKAAVAHALGTHLDLFQRIVVSPCSVSAILRTPGGPIVLAVNSTGDDLRGLVPS